MYISDWSITFIYEGKDEESLLNYVPKIWQFEKDITENSQWPAFCLVESASAATAAAGTITACKNSGYSFVESALEAFVGVTVNEFITGTEAKAALQNEKSKAIGNEWNSKWAGRFDKDLKDPIDKVKYMRTTFRVGAPLKGYKSRYDQPEKQEAEVVKFLKTFEKIIEGKNVDSPFKILMYSKALDDLVFNEVILQDMAWMLGSIVFGFFWMLLHT